jgi:hypothetical protein
MYVIWSREWDISQLEKKVLGWRMPSGPEGCPSGVIPPPPGCMRRPQSRDDGGACVYHPLGLIFRSPLHNYCSRHGFLYIRGWMQMVIAPNDLFSWNNRYNKYSVTNVTNTFTHSLLELCTWTHSVHARVLKPWRGSLPWPPAISSFCHVFPLPLTGLNWRSLSLLGDPVPLPPKWRPYSQGPRTLPYRDPEQLQTWAVYMAFCMVSLLCMRYGSDV